MGGREEYVCVCSSYNMCVCVCLGSDLTNPQYVTTIYYGIKCVKKQNIYIYIYIVYPYTHKISKVLNNQNFGVT